MSADLEEFGVRLGAPTGGAQEWHFGWVPPSDRSNDQAKEHDDIVLGMPKFAAPPGAEDTTIKKVVLWDCSKAVNGGEHFMCFRQITGSCVGNGGGQATWYLSAVEVFRLKQAEECKLPFYLLPYGRSRYYLGYRRAGEGSTGGTFAKAAVNDGFLFFDTPGLPKPQIDSNGITWGKQTELLWSDGSRIDANWLSQSRNHLIRTVSPVRSAADVRAAIKNYYPVTIASNWGGRMQCRVVGTGENRVLLNDHADTWNHQMCIIGWWDHPELGEIFFVLNSWGPRAHGIDPSGGPPGGFWIKAADVDYICRQNDSYAFSQFDGFPAQTFEWNM